MDLTLTYISIFRKSVTAQLIMLTNQVAALRKGVVGVTRDLMGIQELDLLPGFGVNLESVVVRSA